MPNSLPDLLQDRSHLLQELSQFGDFQPGTITTTMRRCGKPNCHCAAAQGPRTRPVSPTHAENCWQNRHADFVYARGVRKAEKEIVEFRRFQTLTHELVAVNQEICRLRPLVMQESGRLYLEAIEMAMRSALRQAGAAALSELLKFDPPGPQQRQRS